MNQAIIFKKRGETKQVNQMDKNGKYHMSCCLLSFVQNER